MHAASFVSVETASRRSESSTDASNEPASEPFDVQATSTRTSAPKLLDIIGRYHFERSRPGDALDEYQSASDAYIGISLERHAILRANPRDHEPRSEPRSLRLSPGTRAIAALHAKHSVGHTTLQDA